MASKRVLLLVCAGAEVFEVAAFFDVLSWPGAHGLEPVEVVTAAATLDVKCSFGFKLSADTALAQVEPAEFDALAIPGGFEEYGFYAAAYSEPVQSIIRQFVEMKKPIATICVGALPLAKTGALTGRRATTYHLNPERRRQLAEFGARVVDEHVVEDGPCITSTCPGSAAAVALRLLARLTGSDSAERVRQLMGFAQT